MISFLLTLRRMVMATLRGLKEPEFQVLLSLTVAVLISGTMFYSNVEGLSILDALYFSVITLATVGYGDFTPQTDFGKIFTIIYILTGVGLIVAFAAKILYYMELPRLRHKAERKARRLAKEEEDDE
ncbi:ion channel [Alkalicoccus luteus]|uniref:Two pore domain potassium channel family protein n=1 Tax=Alkalicoccus luteus TaxID=1237094 RepID=A0A969PUA4_9BACI|nr:two pore domain potassium channel family protein [Alkalicoccus luteus]